MKTGRISKIEEKFISENIHTDYKELAAELDRNAESLLEFIKKKVAKGDLPEPIWMQDQYNEEKAQYDLTFRPYWLELQNQFTDEELKLFQYHWSRIISQFKDDVIPTEELQVVDLIKLELLMNRALKGNKDNIEQITALEALVALERQRDPDNQDKDALFNMERQVASLKASQESLNKDYRELQTKRTLCSKK